MITVDMFMRQNGKAPFFLVDKINIQDQESRYPPKIFRNYSSILLIDPMYTEVLNYPCLFTDKLYEKRYSAEHYEKKKIALNRLSTKPNK